MRNATPAVWLAVPVSVAVFKALLAVDSAAVKLPKMDTVLLSKLAVVLLKASWLNKRVAALLETAVDAVWRLSTKFSAVRVLPVRAVPDWLVPG